MMEGAEESSKHSTIDTLKHQWLLVPTKFKNCYLVHILLSEMSGTTPMVFTRTCATTQLLALVLQNLGLKAIPISSQMNQLKREREAAKFAATGSAIGAISTAGLAWKYSKSPHGAVLALGAGAIFGWTFGQEIANHWMQLYRMDTMAAQLEFLDWWKKRTEGSR